MPASPPPSGTSRDSELGNIKLHLCIVISWLVFMSISHAMRLHVPASTREDWTFRPPSAGGESTDDRVPIKQFPFKSKDPYAQQMAQDRMKRLQRLREKNRLAQAQAGKKQSWHYETINGKKTIVHNKLYNRTLLFVHIHKSAGSLVCDYAFRNDVSCSAQQNCNVQRDQHCCGEQDSVQAQISYAKRTPYDFVAVEREMYDSMAPEYYDYIVSLRKSKERYFSHWRHLRRLMPKIGNSKWRLVNGGAGNSEWLVNVTKGSYNEARVQRTNTILNGSDPLGNFSVWSQGQPDNWNTRIICGPKCMDQAKFQISKDIFKYALERLSKFRHIIFVEDLKNSFDQFAKSYGWKPHNPKKVKNVDAKSKKHGEAKKHEWNPLMSALDDALYEFALRMFRNDTEHLWEPFTSQKQVDEYFEHGPKYGCENGCCGKCSAY